MFEDISGDFKLLASRGDKDFYLRVVTHANQMTGQSFDLLNSLMFDCEQETNKELRRDGKRIAQPHSKEELQQQIFFNQEWAERTFAGGKQTVFLIEDDSTNAVGLVLILINDEKKRAALKVPEDVGTFIYVGDACLSPECRGLGLFAAAFDKITTMVANPKREAALPIIYSISMTSTVAVDDKTGELTNHPMNLPRYSAMWKKRFVDNRVQVRFQDLATREQEGGIRYDIEAATDPEEFSQLLDYLKPQAAERNKYVRGVYLEGESQDYDTMKEFRRPSGTPKPINSTKWLQSQKGGQSV